MKELDETQVIHAIEDGVERAFSNMIGACTDMPSSDFWHVLEKGIQAGARDAVIQSMRKDGVAGVSLSMEEMLGVMMAIESMSAPNDGAAVDAIEWAWSAHAKFAEKINEQVRQ